MIGFIRPNAPLSCLLEDCSTHDLYIDDDSVWTTIGNYHGTILTERKSYKPTIVVTISELIQSWDDYISVIGGETILQPGVPKLETYDHFVGWLESVLRNRGWFPLRTVDEGLTINGREVFAVLAYDSKGKDGQ